MGPRYFAPKYGAISWALIAVFLGLPIGAATAQVAGFDPADYGKAQLPVRQSTGDAATYIEANNGAFEPIGELDAKDPIAALARPIGRVDVVLRHRKTGEEIGTSCTGSLLKDNYVLTNFHCVPAEGELEPIKASILFDYLALDGKAAKRYAVSVKPTEWNATLDYALVKAEGEPNATYGAVKLQFAPGLPGQSLMVIHHPLGRPKMMSRFRCLALREQPDPMELRHRCDTLGGSSGSLVFNTRGEIVALHREGGLDPKDQSSFNTATLFAPILAESATLRRIAASAAPPERPATPDQRPAASAPVVPPGQLDTTQMNDILRGR
jgi:V8-like Glu-specific endopeptidase